MNDREFELGSRKFKLNKLDAFKQFHIARKIGPILGDVVPVLQGLKVSDSWSEEEKFDQYSKILPPIFNGLSKLSDEDSTKVLCGLLSCVEMQQPSGNWARIATESLLMFQDLELPFLIQIAGKAFMYNLAGFFAGGRSK